MKDKIIDNIEEAIKLKFKDPIVLTFFISFLIVNWDLVLITLAVDKPYQARIDDIRASISLIQYVHWSDLSNKEFAKFFGSFRLWHGLRFVAPIWLTYFFLWKWPEIMKQQLKNVLDKKVEVINLSIEANEKRKDIQEVYEEKIKEIRDEYERKLTSNSEMFTEKEQRILHLEKDNSLKDQRIGALNTELENCKKQIVQPKEESVFQIDGEVIKDMTQLSIYDFADKYQFSPVIARGKFYQRCVTLIQELNSYFPTNQHLGYVKSHLESTFAQPKAGKNVQLNNFNTWLQNFKSKNPNIVTSKKLQKFTDARVNEFMLLLDKLAKFDQ